MYLGSTARTRAYTKQVQDARLKEDRVNAVDSCFTLFAGILVVVMMIVASPLFLFRKD